MPAFTFEKISVSKESHTAHPAETISPSKFREFLKRFIGPAAARHPNGHLPSGVMLPPPGG